MSARSCSRRSLGSSPQLSRHRAPAGIRAVSWRWDWAPPGIRLTPAHQPPDGAPPAVSGPRYSPPGTACGIPSADRTVAVQGQADGEHRSAAWLVARFDVPAVQARVLPGDRQAQAAALRTGACGVGLVEPVEHVRDGGRREPRPLVTHFQGQVSAAPVLRLCSCRHGHRRAAVPQHRVADEVGGDDVETATVQPRGQPGAGTSAHTFRPPPRLRAHRTRRPRRRCHRSPALPCHHQKETGNLDQVLNQQAEMEDLLADQPRGGCGVPSRPGCSPSMSATAVIAVSGVRSWWERHRRTAGPAPPSAAARPPCPPALQPSLLKEVTSRASSSRPWAWIRTDRSPPAIRCAACASRRTGRRTRREAAYATPVIAASSTARQAQADARERMGPAAGLCRARSDEPGSPVAPAQPARKVR